MKKVVVIVGPTGSGKTGLSVKLARHFDMEIINGDSVQIYRGLDIGSAKIRDEEKMGVRHHLLDVMEPRESYSVYQFQQDVRSKIKEIDRPMICGGTGLYIKAALYDYAFDDQGRHESFDLSYQHHTHLELYQELISLDPDIIIDPNNRRRLLRALEMAKSGFKRSAKNQKDHLLYDALILYLDIDRKILEERLRLRLEKMLIEGFIEEVKSLKERGLHLNVIGYREMHAYLQGTHSLEETKEEIVKVTKRLAKKQKTFFKNQMQVVMLDALSTTLFEEAKALIQSFYGGISS